MKSVSIRHLNCFSLKIIPYNRRYYPPSSWPYSTEIFGRFARLPHTQALILWQWVCKARPHSRECKQLSPSPFLPEYPGSQSTSFSFSAGRFFSHLTLGGRWLHLSQLCWRVGSLCFGPAKRSPVRHTFCSWLAIACGNTEQNLAFVRVALIIITSKPSCGLLREARGFSLTWRRSEWEASQSRHSR